MAITTTDSLKNGRGEACHRCTKRTRVVRWKDGEGWLCAECDPRPRLVAEAPDDRAVERGRDA